LSVLRLIDLLSTSPSNDTKELDAIVQSRRLYNSCIDENQIEIDGVDAILSLVNTELGGWPILQGSKWDSSTFNFSQLSLQLTEYGSSIVYAAWTQPDPQNSSIYTIAVRFKMCELLTMHNGFSYFRSGKVILVYKIPVITPLRI
jgi:hypothetical protein